MTNTEIKEVLDSITENHGARLEFENKTLSLIRDNNELIGRLDDDSSDLDEDDIRELLRITTTPTIKLPSASLEYFNGK